LRLAQQEFDKITAKNKQFPGRRRESLNKLKKYD
jgi:hypothetical protein